MRDFKGMKRQRGRNRGGGSAPSGGGKPQQNVNRAFDSNGPDNVKIRGHAQHVFEKYQQLARDAFSSGDRVLAENYLQHADHYFRVLRTIQPNRAPAEILGRDVFASGLDIDFEDEGEGFDDGGDTAEVEANGSEPRFEGRYDSGRQDNDRQENGRQDNGRQESGRQDSGRQDSGRQDNGRQNGRQDVRQDGRREERYEAQRDRSEPRREGQENGRFDQRRDNPDNRANGRRDYIEPRDTRVEGRDEPTSREPRTDNRRDYQDRDARQDGRREPQDRAETRRDQQEPREVRADTPRSEPAREGQEPRRDGRRREREPRDDRRYGGRSETTDRVEMDRETSDPLAVIEPETAPLPLMSRAAETEASPVLRSEDGEVSEAPAFLQASAATPTDPTEEAEVRKPRPRRRRPKALDEAEPLTGASAASEGVAEEV